LTPAWGRRAVPDDGDPNDPSREDHIILKKHDKPDLQDIGSKASPRMVLGAVLIGSHRNAPVKRGPTT
jgi:hypothetical protein